MNKSVHLITFLNKMAHFDADLELVSIIRNTYVDNCKDLKTLFPGMDIGYPTLSARAVRPHNRVIAVNHLTNTVYSSYIKDLYEELSLYLHSVVKEAWALCMVTPERLVGINNMPMTYTDILTHVKNHTLESTIIDDIFQKLEAQRSDKKLVKEISARLGIEVDEQIVLAAAEFMDVRHKLVHADGYVSAEWMAEHPSIKCIEEKTKTTVKYYIDLDYQTVIQARDRIKELIEVIDKEAISKGLLQNRPTRNA